MRKEWCTQHDSNVRPLPSEGIRSTEFHLKPGVSASKTKEHLRNNEAFAVPVRSQITLGSAL